MLHLSVESYKWKQCCNNTIKNFNVAFWVKNNINHCSSLAASKFYSSYISSTGKAVDSFSLLNGCFIETMCFLTGSSNFPSDWGSLLSKMCPILHMLESTSTFFALKLKRHFCHNVSTKDRLTGLWMFNTLEWFPNTDPHNGGTGPHSPQRAIQETSSQKFFPLF